MASSFVCKICNRKYSTNFNLTKHLKKKHAVRAGSEPERRLVSTRSVKVLKTCILCKKSFSKSDLLNHFIADHGINLKTSLLKFQTDEEFVKWKRTTETDTGALYVKHQPDHALRDGCVKMHFICHRSGFYRTRGKNIRRLKKVGSSKLDGFCPAQIMVLKKTEEILVHFMETHVGHSMDFDRFLPPKKINTVVNTDKKPFDNILDEARDSVCTEPLSRIHLLNRQDLYNLEKIFNLNSSSVRHDNDYVSVEAWVNHMNAHDSLIRYYKSRGQLCKKYSFVKKKDFFLIFFNETQLETLKKYSKYCICIDGTLGLNSCYVDMVTCLVIDDLRQGFPVAFFITNRTDAETIGIFFETIKENTGFALKPHVFISDMPECFYNSWINVMGPAEKTLYSSWYVDRDWRKNLNKISNRKNKIEVYKKLRTQMDETDENSFEFMLQRVINDLLTSEDTSCFGEYFKVFINCSTSWAQCYRKHAGINSDIHLERMHETLKYIYQHGKNVKRLDKAILTIMRFVKDKVFDRLVVLNKSKLNSRVLEIRQRHKAIIGMSCEVQKIQETSWTLTSSKGTLTYEIDMLATDCDNCRLKCDDCSTCIHKYVCSCPDSSIRWNMCRHIHFLITYYLINETSNSITINENLNVDEDTLTMDTDSVHHNPEETIILQDISASKPPISRRDETLKQLLSLMEFVKSTDDEMAVQIIDSAIQSIQPALNALKSTDGKQIETSGQLGMNIKINIDPQSSYFFN